MKKTITLLIFTLSYFLSAQTWGNREYWISYEYTPKADQISEFEKAVKEKTNKWNTNLETAIFTFEVVNGPNSGTYERWVTRKDRSFFDQDFSKEIEYWKKMLKSISLIKVVNKLGEFLRGLHMVGGLKTLMLISFINKTESW